MNEYNKSLGGMISAIEERLFKAAKIHKAESILSQTDFDDMDALYEIYSSEMDQYDYSKACNIINNMTARVINKLDGLDV